MINIVSMRRSLVVLALGGWLLALPAGATEIPSNQPSDDNAALLQKLNQSQMPPRTQGFVHIEDQKAGVLIQPAGRVFRDVHRDAQFWVDAGFIIVAIVCMAGLYLAVGSMHYEKDRAGRTIKRFNAFERFTHWTMAFSFIVLALTGLNLVFGRWMIQPWMGDDAFAEMTRLGKLSHNFLSIPFVLALVAAGVQWLRHNIPNRLDITWVKMAGGMFGGPHPPAKKFNAGQKMIYWAAMGGGGILTLTGLALMFPFYITDILGMQIIQVAHSLTAAGMVAIIIGHIYLGTVGVRGSFQAMSTGHVDLNWAREHHWLWVEEEVAKGKVEPDFLYPAE
jgi:formate dehydrogenase subunit gamma